MASLSYRNTYPSQLLVVFGFAGILLIDYNLMVRKRAHCRAHGYNGDVSQKADNQSSNNNAKQFINRVFVSLLLPRPR